MLLPALTLLAALLLGLGLPSLWLDATSGGACLLAGAIGALGLAWLATRTPGWRRQLLQGLALLAWALAGFGYGQRDLAQQLAQRWPESAQASEVEVRARIAGLPRHGEERIAFELVLLEALPPLPVGARVGVSWYRPPPGTHLLPGDCARWGLSLRDLRGPVNADGFEPERLALLQRRSARASVKSIGESCASGGGLDLWRDRLADRIDQALPASPARASLKALALGDTREFSDADWAALRATGLTHLMAISGLHIGLVAGFGVLLVRLGYRLGPRLGERLPRPLAEALLALLLATAYAALAGFALPTQRALAGLAAFLLARLLRRNLGVWSAYGLAMIAVLLLDPLAPLAAGFWLSFGAVAWLLYLFARGGPRRPWWIELPRAQILLSLALAPLTAWWFQQGALTGPLINLLVVPWVAFLAVPTALLATALVALLPALAAGPLWLAWQLLKPLWWAMAQLGGEAAPVAAAAPTLAAVLLALLGVAWLFAPRAVPGRLCGLLLFLPLLWPAVPTPRHGELWVEVLDVGQGQATLLRTRGHSLLVDAGPAVPGGFDGGEAMVVPTLRRLGVRRLDRLLVSHADSDHAGGFEAVLAAFRPALIQGQRAPAQAERFSAMLPCEAGQGWHWDGVEFELLHPPLHFPYLGNESSCVLRVQDGHGAVLLLPGDIGQIIEQRLLREQGGRLQADVLLSPHHGSNGSSGSDFLQAVAADSVIHSAGWGNRFRMPRPEVVARVAATGAEQWSTAHSGMLSLRSDGAGGFALHSLRARQPRPWRGADLGRLQPTPLSLP